MKPTSILGWVSGAALLGFCAVQAFAPPARSESGLLVRNGEIGFVAHRDYDTGAYGALCDLGVNL